MQSKGYLIAFVLVAMMCLTAEKADGDAVVNGDNKADLVLAGGSIVTMDPGKLEAEALACKGDRIIAVGDKTEIDGLIGPDTIVIDLKGNTAFPGFIESHGHFVALGESMQTLQLAQAKSWEEVVALVHAASLSRPEGEWIIGWGWHQEKWGPIPQPNVDGYPIHTALSEAVPDHPVLLTHATGHMSLANALAMKLSDVTAKTQSPPGGEILRDDAGEPTGVFRETAQGLVKSPSNSGENSFARLDEAIQLAGQASLRKGVTSFQDAGASFAMVERFQQLAESGHLPVRLWVMLLESNEQLSKKVSQYKMVGAHNNFLTVRAIKRLIDGALGAHGAWLLEPYADMPSSRGLQTLSTEALKESARLAVKNDLQLCVHAIGDRANREVLDLFEETFAQFSSGVPRRWRIEHAQHLHPDDIPRFAELGVVASMQGVHCTSDAVFVEDRLGRERAENGAYVWQTLLRTGTVVANGTDTPVEDVDPVQCFYATVTRRLSDGSTFFPKQKMTREQALRSYTLGAAYAAFEENIKGSLSTNKFADIVVLSKNLLTCPEDEILKTEVVYTIVGGKIAYSQKGLKE